VVLLELVSQVMSLRVTEELLCGHERVHRIGEQSMCNGVFGNQVGVWSPGHSQAS
jgi:hypothetical protein